jgi:creatinine amidohydrolase/Fe(II)-dependent formamide hydrolase-like protein
LFGQLFVYKLTKHTTCTIKYRVQIWSIIKREEEDSMIDRQTDEHKGKEEIGLQDVVALNRETMDKICTNNSRVVRRGDSWGSLSFGAVPAQASASGVRGAPAGILEQG